MRKLFRIIVIIVLCCLLLAVRSFAPVIFYDPFIEYFQNDFLSTVIPQYDRTLLLVHLFLRYLLNTAISLAILYVVFLNKRQIKLALVIFGVAGVVLMFIYNYQVSHEFSNGYLVPFYIRRLLIHPVLLLVLIPAFYYQDRNSKL